MYDDETYVYDDEVSELGDGLDESFVESVYDYDVHVLINNVRKNACLFDKTSPEYKDTVKKASVWKAIGKRFVPPMSGKFFFCFF